MRVFYDEGDLIQDILSHESEKIRLVIPLGDHQYDLAVTADGVCEVEDNFLNITFCRLDLLADPLFIKKYARDQTPLRVLKRILGIYIEKRKGLHGAELSWVDAEIKHLEAKIKRIWIVSLLSQNLNFEITGSYNKYMPKAILFSYIIVEKL